MKRIRLKQTMNRVSWGSIFGGIITVLAISVLLAVLSASIGFFTIDPLSNKPFSGVGTGIGIVTVISLILSLAAGGFVAGKLAGADGIIHGFLTWAGTMIITVIFSFMLVKGVTNMAFNALGSVASFTGSLITGGSSDDNSSSTLSNVAESVFGSIDFDARADELQQDVRRALRRSGVRELQPEYLNGQMEAVRNDLRRSVRNIVANPQQAESIIEKFVERTENRINRITNNVDKQDIARTIAAGTNMSVAQAEDTIDQYLALVDQGRERIENLRESLDEAQVEWERMKHEALVGLDNASNAAGRGAMWAFFAFLIGAVICALAGMFGTRMTEEGHEA